MHNYICIHVCNIHNYGYIYISTVSVWDGKDGACLKYVCIPGNHTGIKVRHPNVPNLPFTHAEKT